MGSAIPKLSQEEFEDRLVKDCGMRIIGRYRGVTTMELRVNLYTLPPPVKGRYYARDEIQHILDIWYNDCPDSVKIEFVNGKFKEV